MLRKIIFTLLLSTFVYASESLDYCANESKGLDQLFSSKQAELIRNLYVHFDLSSALVMLDQDFANDISKNAPKRLNPDKTLLTLSYRF